MMGLEGRYTVSPSPLDESKLQQTLRGCAPREYTRILAQHKARALAETIDDNSRPTIVLGSDTIVEQDGIILEKPTDAASAKAMLQQLSGRSHQVHTGVALLNSQNAVLASFTDTANVTFATLSPLDIDAYIATGEPMDKAGSYGIQGVGGQFVASIEGDFFTVMGLPMHRVSQSLAEAIQTILIDRDE